MQISVGVTTTPVLEPNPYRKKLTIVNTSANWVSIFYNLTAGAIYSGKTLSPNGGALFDDRDIFGYIYGGAISAIASGAASVISVSEET
jgi:hypothetical protein